MDSFVLGVQETGRAVVCGGGMPAAVGGPADTDADGGYMARSLWVAGSGSADQQIGVSAKRLDKVWIFFGTVNRVEVFRAGVRGGVACGILDLAYFGDTDFKKWKIIDGHSRREFSGLLVYSGGSGECGV